MRLDADIEFTEIPRNGIPKALLKTKRSLPRRMLTQNIITVSRYSSCSILALVNCYWYSWGPLGKRKISYVKPVFWAGMTGSYERSIVIRPISFVALSTRGSLGKRNEVSLRPDCSAL